MERIMKMIQWLMVSATLAIGMATPASAGTNDPEIIIYRFPGVRDNGGNPGAGVATVFHCTNFSGATENIRFATRDAGGTLGSNMTILIDHLTTRNASTHLNAAYNSD